MDDDSKNSCEQQNGCAGSRTEQDTSSSDAPTGSLPERNQLHEEVDFAALTDGTLLELIAEHYMSIRPAVIPGSEKLRPRARDLLSSLAAPFAHDKAWCEMLLAFFLEMHEPANQEPLSRAQSAVLATLFAVMHLSPDRDCMTVGAFGQLVNEFLRGVGERISLSPQKTGRVLTSLGISSRERTNRGWQITLDNATRLRVHKLVRTYGNEYLNDPVIRSRMANCPMCKETGNVA